jgi:hypothetical protein
VLSFATLGMALAKASRHMNYTTTITKRKRARKTEYLARLVYTDGATGKRKERSKSASSSAEAKRILKDLENEYLAGGQTAIESHEMTFPELVAHCKETRYCEAQFDSEGRKILGVRGKDTVEAHIKALEGFFGPIKLRDIKVANLRSYRQHRLMTEKTNKERLSVSTVNREMSTLRAMLNEAVVNDWIIFNPFNKARPGELIRVADERKRETILTPAEEKRLLDACGTPRRRHLKALVIAALDTGARQGELLSLRWSDVDFEEGVIKNITRYCQLNFTKKQNHPLLQNKSTSCQLVISARSY